MCLSRWKEKKCNNHFFLQEKTASVKLIAEESSDLLWIIKQNRGDLRRRGWKVSPHVLQKKAWSVYREEYVRKPAQTAATATHTCTTGAIRKKSNTTEWNLTVKKGQNVSKRFYSKTRWNVLMQQLICNFLILWSFLEKNI